ncbi:MAG: FAD-binding protein [Thermodesulfobacteriota bacterium]|nr:FAD-binding protein [Thermodesulfobacteriota bacterium]
MSENKVLKTDVLIIGVGASGILAAIRAQEEGADALLITSGALGRDSSITWMAGGGLVAAFYPPDSPEAHAEDTIKRGRFLSDQELVLTLLKQAPKNIMDLDKWGMRFRRTKDGRFEQGLLHGHSQHRGLLHKYDGEFLGRDYRNVLSKQVRRRGLKLVEDCFITDLLTQDERVVGAVGIDIREGEFKIFRSKVTILATGGFPSCYKFYCSSPQSTGTGLGMAYRAGAEFVDMEFVNFYANTCIWPPIFRGEIWPTVIRHFLSGIYLNKYGVSFWEDYKRKGITGPQAIMQEIREGRGTAHGGIYLSCIHLPENLLEDFYAAAGKVKWLQKLKKVGFDLSRKAVEVCPTSLSTLGGCKVDTRCKTNVPGLYAAGEIASGTDGAHTINGNQMSFSLTMGSLAGREAAREAKKMRMEPSTDDGQVMYLKDLAYAPIRNKGDVRPFELKKRIREVMWEYANIVGRTEEGLQTAIDLIGQIREEVPKLSSHARNRRFNLEWMECLEIDNMLTVCEMTIRSALTREESRGLHFREDFPQMVPDWLRNVIVRKQGDVMSIGTAPVSFSVIRPE